MAAMFAVLSILKRTLLVPAVWPVAVVAVAAAWIGNDLAAHALGGDGAFVAEVRHGSLLFAALLLLSMAEPLQMAQETRSGLLMLRHGKGGGFALVARGTGLILSLLPLLCLAAWASGGLPAAPWGLLAQVAVLVAGGLVLGAWLDRRRLVAALWALAIVGQLRPWLTGLDGSAVWVWLVPDLGAVGAGAAWAHGLLWALGALALAHGRLTALSAR